MNKDSLNPACFRAPEQSAHERVIVSSAVQSIVPAYSLMLRAYVILSTSSTLLPKWSKSVVRILVKYHRKSIAIFNTTEKSGKHDTEYLCAVSQCIEANRVRDQLDMRNVATASNKAAFGHRLRKVRW